jgi:hypothetical protein
MEIKIIGEGEVVIRFIDRNGQTLLQERLVVSGPIGVQALRQVPLSIGTIRGPAEVSPVIVSGSNTGQRVTFDGQDPARFTKSRCRAIGCNAALMRDAALGLAPPPAAHGSNATTVGEPVMADVLRAASVPTRRRR